MNKKVRSLLCIVMVMLTIALTVPATALSAFAAELLPPANLKSASTTSSITLSWDAAKSATGYRVYVKNKCGWQKKADVDGTSITFNNLPAAKKYTLAVKSFYKCDCHSKRVTWSKDFAIIHTATAPKVPSKIKLTANGSKLKISWTPSKGADGYVVYYEHPPFGWKELKNTAKTSVTLDKLVAGVKYKFAIRPYINTKSGTVWGDYKEFTGALAPKATKLTVTSPENNTAVLTWTRVCGADGYALYYKLNNGKYKLYDTYAKPQKDLKITNLKRGKYTFVVRPYVKTSVGKVCGAYTPVTVEVDGLLPCGCEPVCAYCGPNTKKCDCHRGHRH